MARQHFDPRDIARNRVLGGLGYLSILFIIPLIACRNSRYARYCANQGLLVMIVQIAVALVFWVLGWMLGWIPVIGWLVGAAKWLVNAVISLTVIYHAILAISSGDARELPFIGHITLIR